MRKSLLAMSLLMVALAACNSGNNSGTGSDSTASASGGSRAFAAGDTSKLSAAAVPVFEAQAFMKHYRDAEVDSTRKKAKFSEFSIDLLDAILAQNPKQLQFFYGAYPNDAKYGDKKNWPVLLLKVQFNTVASEPRYYIAPSICPPPEGACADEETAASAKSSTTTTQ